MKPRFDYQKILTPITSRDVSHCVIIPLIVRDECLNNPTIDSTISALCRGGLASGSRDLWYQPRIRNDGSLLMVMGRPNKELLPSLDIGKQLKHASWDDQYIVYLLVGHFAISAKLVLLSENIKNDRLGLRHLLTDYIKPYLSLYHRNIFSLTVLFKKGGSNYEDYCKHIIKFFREGPFDYGFSEYWL
jgi:hypothetical protein